MTEPQRLGLVVALDRQEPTVIADWAVKPDGVRALVNRQAESATGWLTESLPFVVGFLDSIPQIARALTNNVFALVVDVADPLPMKAYQPCFLGSAILRQEFKNSHAARTQRHKEFERAV